MAKTKVLLVEEAAQMEIALQSRLASMDFDVVDVMVSPEMAIDYLKNNKVDIILMDLFLTNKTTANQAINTIKKEYYTPVILFRGDQKLNINQLENPKASLIMQKPLNDLDLAFNIKAAINNKPQKTEAIVVQNAKEYIFVKADYKLNKIRLKDLFYVEASKDYVSLHTKDNTYIVHATMKDMEQALSSSNFIRTHRSFIVNIDKIFSIKYPEILIEQKMKTIQIGGLYRKKLMDIIEVI